MGLDHHERQFGIDEDEDPLWCSDSAEQKVAQTHTAAEFLYAIVLFSSMLFSPP